MPTIQILLATTNKMVTFTGLLWRARCSNLLERQSWKRNTVYGERLLPPILRYTDGCKEMGDQMPRWGLQDGFGTGLDHQKLANSVFVIADGVLHHTLNPSLPFIPSLLSLSNEIRTANDIT